MAVRARPERNEPLCTALHGCTPEPGEYRTHTAIPAWLPKEPRVCASALGGFAWGIVLGWVWVETLL